MLRIDLENVVVYAPSWLHKPSWLRVDVLVYAPSWLHKPSWYMIR